MANIKFSAFTQKVASADVDFLVGYTGGDNVRITPSVFDDRYLPLTGGTITGNVKFLDFDVLEFGTGADLRIYHASNNSYLDNYVGDIYIQNFANDKDILFRSDDGSGGLETYLSLDGSDRVVRPGRSFVFPDNISANFGAGYDLNIKHDGAESYIENNTGDLRIRNLADDSDITFESDNGSGGTTEYVRLDGANVRTKFSKNTIHTDNIKANFGNGSDLQIYHDSGNNYIQGVTGDMYIQNGANDRDIIFRSDDGSGGQTEYFRLDGGNGNIITSVNNVFADNKKLCVGSSADLQIYHDGSHSYIQDTGTGDLKLQASNDIFLLDSSSNVMIEASEGGSVDLFHNGSKKFETTNTGIKITGVNQYADNAAALAGGLTVGDVYRTGDLLKIVN